MNNFPNWQQVKFDGFDSVPNSSGVYLICVQTTNDVHVVVYVGSTNNIKESFKQHWSADEKSAELKNLIRNCGHALSIFYSIDEVETMKNHEEFLLNKFSPQLNESLLNTKPAPLDTPKRVMKGTIKQFYFE